MLSVGGPNFLKTGGHFEKRIWSSGLGGKGTDEKK